MIMHHVPHVLDIAFQSDLTSIRWADNEQDFSAWCAGRTGYPVVDAAMRQLAQSGWMHNRTRMIAGSFLVKDLKNSRFWRRTNPPATTRNTPMPIDARWPPMIRSSRWYESHSENCRPMLYVLAPAWFCKPPSAYHRA
jgi:hypothetical protein